MKPKGASPRKPVLQQLPIVWMDPMSWRLPSGQALAEFALQAGFLAPLMLGTPGIKRRKPVKISTTPVAPLPGPIVEKHLGEGPEVHGTFRETR